MRNQRNGVDEEGGAMRPRPLSLGSGTGGLSYITWRTRRSSRRTPPRDRNHPLEPRLRTKYIPSEKMPTLKATRESQPTCLRQVGCFL